MSGSNFGITLVTALSFSGATAAFAQEPKPLAQPVPAAKVYDVPKEGLVISGKLTKDDPPLAGAPVAELNGAPHQVFHVRLVKGQYYVIDLMSKDFDAYLILQNAIGKVLAHDDDSGGGQNSRIVYEAKANGVYRVVAAALDRKPGDFQLVFRATEVSQQSTLAAEARKLDQEVDQLYRQGQAADAVVKIRAALEIRRKLYPATTYPDGHPDLAASLNNLAFLTQTMGKAEQAVPFFEQSLAMRRKLFPASRYPDGHPELAQSLDNLGCALQAMGQAEKAFLLLQQGLTMRQKVFPESKYPDGHPDLAVSFNNLGVLLSEMGQSEKALAYYEQCLAVGRKLHPESRNPDGHPNVARYLDNLAFELKTMGHVEKALPLYAQSLAMRRQLYPESKYPNGHSDLADSFDHLSVLLQALGRAEEALHYEEQSLAMKRQLFAESKYPDGHPDLAFSLNSLGRLLEALGQAEKALPYCEQALIMRRKLFPETTYPDGHPRIAASLNSVGSVLLSVGQVKQALPYYAQSLNMRRRLFPTSKYVNGHADLAQSLNNAGFVLQTLRQPEKALPYYEQSLAMTRKLFPASQYQDGHPDLAICMTNLAAVLETVGQADKALPLLEQSLAMRRQLFPESKFPDGHHNLADAIHDLGFVLNANGRTPQAARYFDEALAMRHKLERRFLATASEAEALAYLSHLPAIRDVYLSFTLQLTGSSTSAYDAVWRTKSAITRVLAQRYSAARVAGAAQAAQLDELKGLRRRIDQLLQDRRLPPVQREKLLTTAVDDRDKLERILAKAFPARWRALEVDAAGPEMLATLLPESAVLIDMILYTRLTYDPAKPGTAGEKRTPSYAAFVLSRAPFADAVGMPLVVKRVELGPAKTLDRAVADWRAAIDGRTSSPVASELLDMVWMKLAPHLPAGTKTLYLAPDGDLARVPWTALPTGANRVLLDDYHLATVPHGPFLLEALKYPREYRGNESALLVGGLDYNSKTWPNLPGTVTELTALAPLAPAQQLTLTKSSATPDALCWGLKKARYAHIATHGYFDAKTLTIEKKREAEALLSRQFGKDARRVVTKNPLGFTGMVLANGDVMTGLSLVDLPLENLKLVTLSACETGLGEYTAGEGVQGLQRVFHLAGCPNVVASLWKVNDAATAALMTKFYHELWVNKKPPIEALREAQLTIYRHPELIPDLAGERGAPRLKEAVAVRATAPATGTGKRADTKLWAAFVLSGAGR